ncbi:hypothetical protein DRP05_12565 [Archaeoglobales archaeon]|nr:MAG: hypothetical protein DRP05_12565 [Archaeoglobales archaeon]
MRFKIVQTVLPEETILELKEVSGEKTVKNALFKAIIHYLECPEAGSEEGKIMASMKRHKGRFPIYLEKIMKEAVR